MIDFRYHLVSLISVFLALAVGIVLGAGPLQNSLGTALTDQVTSLREDRNATHAQLEQTETAVNERDEYITQASQAFLPGTLGDASVVLVLLPEAQGDDVDAVSKALTTAGATISGQVSLTTAWADASRETFRSTYAGQFGGYMTVPEAAEGNTVLGMGLGTMLVTTGENATSLSDLLTASDTPLATLDARPSAPADAVVVVGPREPRAGQATPTPSAQVTKDAWAQALTGLADVVPTVVLGDGQSAEGVVAQLRTARAKVATIDSVGQVSAAVSAPLALVQVMDGTRQAYGFNDGADAVMPPVGAAASGGHGAPAAEASASSSPADGGASDSSEGQ